MEQQLQLDWSTADVRDGTLTVGLSDTPPKKWRKAFERTALLLGARTWDVKLNSKKASVSVASVRQGDEDRVRQFLEGAVLEANTTLVSEQELFEGEQVDEEEPEPDSGSPESSPDEELTGRFREFAEAPADDVD